MGAAARQRQLSAAARPRGTGLLRCHALRLALGMIICLAMSACNLQGRAASSLPRAATVAPAGPPRIRINSPGSGDEFVIDEEILVAVSAADDIGVNRVQLFVDERIVRTVSSESLQGETSMDAILNYQPQRRDIGSITLRALAYRGEVPSEPVEIAVQVRESRAQLQASPQAGNLPFIPRDNVCRALVNVGLNFRSGPGTAYRIIRVLPSGTVAEITGRNSAFSWWRLQVEQDVGWVSSDFTTEYGDCSALAPLQ